MESGVQPLWAFDLDGTLIDSKPSIVSGIRELMTSLDLPAVKSDGDIRSLIGLPLPDMFVALGVPSGDYEVLRATYSEAMYAHMRQHMRPLPGVIEALNFLHAQRATLAVVTSRGRDSYEPCLQIAGIDPTMFAWSVCRDDTVLHKPHPQPLLKLSTVTGRNVREMIYVGDAPVDMDCAKAAGCFGIYVLCDADHETPQSAEWTLQSMSDIVANYDQFLTRIGSN